MAKQKKQYIKLVINTKKNQIVYVEAGKDFVDALFGFLTLPLGIISKILDKKSELGCIDSLYKCVQKIDPMYFQTKACKNMLSSLHSESDQMCQDMKFRYNKNWKRRISYCCPSLKCNRKKSPILASFVPDTLCSCGKVMGSKRYARIHSRNAVIKDGIFVKGDLFIVTDDLHVMPSSNIDLLELMNRLGIDDFSFLEKKTVKLDKDKILKLLATSLVSNTPLTDVFLHDKVRIQSNNALKHYFDLKEVFGFSREDTEYIKMKQINKLTRENIQKVVNSKKFSLNLIRNRVTKKPICMVAGGDFVDVMFSFLTFPLAFIMKISGEKNLVGLGSIVHLYQSVLDLVNDSGCNIQSKQNILAITEPKLAPYYGSNNQFLNIEETKQTSFSLNTVYLFPAPNKPRRVQFIVNYINPKSVERKLEVGGAYLKVESKFIVQENMQISPFSAEAVLDAIKKSKLKFNELEEEKIVVTEFEAFKFLLTSLVSKKSLSLLFYN